MKVIRAGILGFCMGVRRAVEMAWQEQSGQVYTLGPLIHNPRVLKALEERGIKVLEDGQIPPANSTVIIRAHGVPPIVEEELVREGIRILDATCPHVKQSQMKARSFAERGYRVFLAGGENHGEITGIRGCLSSCFVVGSPEDAQRAGADLFLREPGARTALIGQTTISRSEYRAIGESLRQFFPSLETADTICSATVDRQEALRELCGQVDALVIIGGRQSANTLRLLSLARELGKPSWLAETAEDLPPQIHSYETIGLSAGASTPDSLIAEIEETLIYRNKSALDITILPMSK